MNVIGYGVFVRLAPLTDFISRESFFTEEFLAAQEKDLWIRCLTKKRKIDFIGGRIAGKTAANVYRLKNGRIPCKWNEISIFPQADNRPGCRHYDGIEHAISISHSNGWAGAVVVSEADRVALDIENDWSRKLPAAAMFCNMEASRLENPKDAWQRWTIKESYCKLTGKGILGWEQELITYKAQDKLWLAIPSQMNLEGNQFLASGSCFSMMISIGFGRL